MTHIFSHVKWFTSGNLPQVGSLNFIELLAATIIVFLGLVVLHYIATRKYTQKLSKKTDTALKPYRSWVPLVVRLTAAGMLVINQVQGYLLAPNVEATSSVMSDLVGYVFIAAAALIALGLYTQVGAVLLFLLVLLYFVCSTNFCSLHTLLRCCSSLAE